SNCMVCLALSAAIFSSSVRQVILRVFPLSHTNRCFVLCSGADFSKSESEVFREVWRWPSEASLGCSLHRIVRWHHGHHGSSRPRFLFMAICQMRHDRPTNRWSERG